MTANDAACFTHPDRRAASTCHYCERGLCKECAGFNRKDKYSYCRNEDDCLRYQTGTSSSPASVAEDPKGYYARLGVSPSASAADIKAAFRRRALELHPDRNPSPRATQEFQHLNEAYSVLSDPEARAEYDTLGVEMPTAHQGPSEREVPPEPIVCSSCGNVTAQPRYVIFYEVKSFIFVTTRTPIQGVFCSACAERKALHATVITWVLGWWGFPWGFIYSPHAIFVNLLGGQRPHNVNARLAAFQAWVFAALGKLDMARAIARDALDLARKIRPEHVSARGRKTPGHDVDDEGARLRKEIGELLSRLGAGGTSIRLKDSWSLFRRPFFVQGLIGLTLIGVVGGVILNDKPSPPPRGPKPYIVNPERASAPTPVYVRPTTAPNGQSWPTAAGYVPDYRRLQSDGLSTVTVDNSQNNSDVFAKLVSLDGPQAYPVRTFFIPAYGSFTLNKVTAGNYDVRYRDLNTGRLSRSESFNLEEIPTDNGIQYSTITMTLYKVRHGNMQVYELSEAEF